MITPSVQRMVETRVFSWASPLVVVQPCVAQWVADHRPATNTTPRTADKSCTAASNQWLPAEGVGRHDSHTFIPFTVLSSTTMGSEDHSRDGDTRSILLEAAYHTLCEHGFAEFSLRKVATQAGKSRGLVHYHFDSKTDLLTSMLDYLIGQFEARFDDAGDRTAIERLDDILEWIAFGPALFGRDGDDYFTAIFELRAQAPYDEAIRDRLTRNYETVRDRIATVIETGIDDGELVEVDPRSTATFIVTAVDGARNTDLTLDSDETVETTLSAIEQFVFESLKS